MSADDDRKAARRALKRHAAILICILLFGVLWLAVATWLGFVL